ncbi:MAG: ABC transporter ATP-binding protein [Lachnospiraceae bacterium]|nr:ABC transporter ATP-binding protein [Lachnospiraceae bacterium]
MKTKKESKQNTVTKVVRLVKRLDSGFLPVMVFTKLIAALQPFLLLWFTGRILDMVIEKRTMEEIMKWVLVMVCCTVVPALLRWALEGMLGVMRRRIAERVSQMISEKSLDLDYEVLEKKETLEMIHKAKEGMNSNGNISFFCEQLGNAVESVAGIVYSLILFFGVCIPAETTRTDTLTKVLNAWWSPFFILAVGTLVLLLRLVLQKQRGVHSQRNFERNVGYNRKFGYYFGFLTRYKEGKDIRLYGMQDMITDGLRECNKNNEESSNIMLRESKRHVVFLGILFFFLQGGSYLYVGLKAVVGLISVGSVLQYVSAFERFCDGLGGVMSVSVTVKLQSKYLSLFEDFMELENKKYEGTLPVEKRDDNKYEIEFRDVSFRYPNSPDYVLSHVNAKLCIGEKTAMVGPNGAGKTTFIKLLCRLYDPTEGEILLNDINIKLYDYKEYMSLFSVVFQDFQLFAFSVAENVATSMDYDEKRIVECIEAAGLKERLQELPEGIRTNLYQLQNGGVEVSGGEAQKLAIARALYKDAPFVVLDEPTSALDPVAEYDIYKRFDDLVQDKTAVYISHRMSSCRFCDNIFVFDEGRIVQKGSHEGLMREEGLYSRLWNAQAQYYN